MLKQKNASLKEGGTVWIPCEVKEGMFPTERYIHVEVLGEKAITGFIPREAVKEEGQVRAVIAQVVKNSTALLFRGELLSATNQVMVPTSWLASETIWEHLCATP